MQRSLNLPVLTAIVLTLLISASGCQLIPQQTLEPTLHNPFPQLQSVAIIPFMNKSEEPTLNMREFAVSYYNELQAIDGFDVVSVSTVEQTMLTHDLAMQSPEDVYRLGELLGVDAVIVGAVNEFDTSYPPRCAIEVEWFAMNPCFHPIPPGYGLPWGTEAEETIPSSIVFDTEMSLARAQLNTQSPIPPQMQQQRQQIPPQQSQQMQPPMQQQQQFAPQQIIPPPQQLAPQNGMPIIPRTANSYPTQLVTAIMPYPTSEEFVLPGSDPRVESPSGPKLEQIPAPATTGTATDATNTTGTATDPAGEVTDTDGATNATPDPNHGFAPINGPNMSQAAYPGYASLPSNWPDPRGLIPDGPQPVRAECIYSGEPVIRHTAIYHGNDSDFTKALQDYYSFQTDGRIGGWQHYLRRSEDFTRFCCRMHIWETLSARGGSGDSRISWRIPQYTSN